MSRYQRRGITKVIPQPPDYKTQVLEELRGIHAELVLLREGFDEFARVFLNAQFPYGQPVDTWRRPRA